MKYFLSLLAILIAICLHGQNPELETFHSKKIQLGILFSPDLCYRSLGNAADGTSASTIIEVRNNNETPKVGYTTGLKVFIPFNHRSGFETGIQYSNKGYKDERHGLIWPGGGQDPNPIISTTFIYKYHYIDVPAIFKYRLGSGINHFLIGAGLTANFLLDAIQTLIVERQDRSTERQSDSFSEHIKRINLSPTVMIGYEYAMSEHLALRIEPAFQYQLLNVIDAPYKEQLFSMGLNVTCYLR